MSERISAPHRPAGGGLVARHLPCARRPAAAPPCRGGRAQAQFHHPRYRRPAPPAEAAHRRPRISTTRNGRPALLLAAIERWKDRGLTPGQGDRGRAGGLCRRASRSELYRQYQERLRHAERLRFRRSAAAQSDALRRPSRGAGRVPAAVPLHPGGRVSGHQRRAISLAAAAGPGPAQPLLRRRRRPVDLWLARRGGRQHPALRERFSRRQDHPAGAQLPLDRPYPRARPRA